MMKYMLTCLLMTCLLVSLFANDAIGQTTETNEQNTDTPLPFRVMSFNIRTAYAQDPPSVWPDRRERVLKTIQTYDPDILAVQEAMLTQARYLRDEMEGYVFFGIGRDDGRLGGEMCAIYYKSKRFLRIGGGHFWLSEKPDEPGSYGWDANCPRMVSWLRLRDKTDRRVYLMANTHWDHVGDKARLNSAMMMRERLPDLTDGAAILITGDFNCNEDSEPYRTLVFGQENDPLKFMDAYRVMHPQRTDQEATFNGFRGLTEGSRIDWILYGPGLTTLAAEIDTTHEGLKYPSDHYPVTATLQAQAEKSDENQP